MDTAAPKRFTTDDYHRMHGSGIFSSTERIELIKGEIIEMAAKSTAHTSAVLLTHHLLTHLLGDTVFVQCQDPIQLSNFSEPEVDIAIIQKDPQAYSTHHPTAKDVFLLIEIAGFGLNYDKEVKAPLYAASGIQDYWILDVLERELHIFRHPMGDRYQSHSVLAETLSVKPLAFSHIGIQIKDMLPPKALEASELKQLNPNPLSPSPLSADSLSSEPREIEPLEPEPLSPESSNNKQLSPEPLNPEKTNSEQTNSEQTNSEQTNSELLNLEQEADSEQRYV